MLIINKNTAFKAIFVLHNRYIKRLIYIMYSNMASRQWFIGVKSNTDKQKTGSVTPIQTSKAGERSPPLRSVEQILRKLRAARAQRCVGSPHPTRYRVINLVQIS